MPTTPKNSTDTSRNSATKYPSADRLRQIRIGTMATTNITASPSAKRFAWGSTHGRNEPPATE